MAVYAITAKGGDIVIYGDGEIEDFSDNHTNSDKNSKLSSEKTAGDEVEAGNTEKVSSENDNEHNKTEEIKVYVIGCVKNPGIVTLKKGQLIDDAVKAAGGLTDDADIYNINLVYSLNENMMLRIKSKNEVNEEENEGEMREEGKGVAIITDEGAGVNTAGQGTSNKTGKININTASVNELDTLPGIGIATANDIIAYREANGKFKSIEDIMKVPRIKENRFNNIKDFITVD
ncbi:MAG TPA: competence protein ComEA [Clostridiaceae bacterium]|nr:competence protein ComEA [Clostridiaceae bacterium]